MAPPASKVWNFFLKKDKAIAQCKTCFNDIKYSGNTTNLTKHLQKHHPKLIVLPPKSSTENSSSSKSYLSIEASGDSTKSADNLPTPSTSAVTQNVPVVMSPLLQAFSKASSYSEGGLRHAKIVKCILFFICKDNRPFDVIKGQGFKRLIRELAPSFTLPSVKFIKKHLVMNYEVISDQVKRRIAEAPNICLTMDVWTETMSERSFLGVTVHFLEGTNFVSFEISTKALSSRHTADNLKEEISEILTKWGVEEAKISSIITDNGANIVAAVKRLFLDNNVQLPCFAHTLNLVLQSVEAVPFFKCIVNKVRNIVIYIKNSVVMSDKLRKIQLDNNVPEGSVVKMIVDVKTRWNSTYHMLSRFIQMLKPVNEILLDDTSSPDMLSSSEIEELKQLNELLKPFDYITTNLSGESYVTISQIIPMVNCLQSQLRDFTTTSQNVIDTKSMLLKELEKRFGQVELVPKIAIATVLDPRFKNLHFKDPVANSKSLTKIREALKQRDTSSSTESEGEDESYDFWKTHKLLAHGGKKRRMNQGNSELGLYLGNQVSPLKSNPLEVWEEMRSVFPGLYKQARMHLVNMATSVPAERLFSNAGSIMCAKRNRLSPSYLDKLVFLGSMSEEEWGL